VLFIIVRSVYDAYNRIISKEKEEDEEEAPPSLINSIQMWEKDSKGDGGG